MIRTLTGVARRARPTGGLRASRAAAPSLAPALQPRACLLSHAAVRRDAEAPRDEEILPFLPARLRSKSKAASSRYDIGKLLGSGKTAVVKEAVDRETGAHVAIKIMNKRASGRELCLNELQVLDEITDAVDHPRLSPIKDVFEDADNLYFVLELMDGGELYDHVVDKGRMNEVEAAVVVRKLIFALEALHRHGIIHRDIKPENILLQRGLDGHRTKDSFKITDFGMALHLGDKDTFKAPAGTLGYAAPEVLQAREYGPPCDVWSAGIVSYILLAGYAPFPLDEERGEKMDPVEAELEAIAHGRAPANWHGALREDPWDGISSEAKEVITGMLDLNPSRRLTTRQVLHSPWIRRSCRARQFEYTNFE